jgi:peptide/nickel transport system permease protein
MINDGRSFLQDHPNLSLVPSAVLFATVLALNFAGDVLRSRFDTKDVSV